MIFGWLQHGVTDRWVLVDMLAPWMSLHNARNALREWADIQQRARALEHTAGPRRCPWPCAVHAKEDGAVELRIWPCEPYGKPRAWTPRDSVWRDPLTNLAELVALDIKCPVEMAWMTGTEIELATVAPSLSDREGFLCWGKGEREPKAHPLQDADPRKIKVTFHTTDIRLMPQGEDAWH
jgi:hypothetical protein